jgi:Protein of unknown function (DUF3105)
VTRLERVAILLASLALSVGLVALLSGFFSSRDQGALVGANVPGVAFRDLGDATLAAGELRPAYDSDPPTSGPHVPERVRRDGGALSDDQLLTALAAGDVVIMYGGSRPPAALMSLARSVAAPFTPALAAAGQAVILASRPGTGGLIALAWTRMLKVARASDPRLRAFASFWLGRGAPA